MLDNVRRQISAKIDPVGGLAAAGTVAKDAAKNPAGVASATGNLAMRLAQIPPAAVRVAFGSDAAPPTNSPITNPTVLARAIATGGKSLARRAGYALEDALQRGGRPLRVDHDAFTLGENMAATPGQVVFRNDLIELIQYAPQTKQVHAISLLACPPWINKYYIMDLGPNRSLIEWAVQNNRTVFVISYRNPDSSMRGVTFDDYLAQGMDAAMDVVLEITGAPKVDVVGVCLGGAMASIAAGHFAGKGDERLGTLTLINAPAGT